MARAKRRHIRTSKRGRKFYAGKAASFTILEKRKVSRSEQIDVVPTGLVEPVSNFNRRQRIKYEAAREEFRQGKRDFPPNVRIYFFVDKSGNIRDKGFVLRLATGGYHYGKTRKELTKLK